MLLDTPHSLSLHQNI